MAPGFGAWLLLVCLLYFVLVIKCIPAAAQCIHSEREALIKFKSKLHDPFHRLASWDDGPNCCQWEGITCDNNTGNVVELDIRGPCTRMYPNYYGDTERYRCQPLISEEIDPVLAQLKHLRYIDLSFNMFAGQPIPSFLGSMKELHYLNLSGAGFSGSVPKQLGNLSNLQVLDISSIFILSFLPSTDFNWLKGKLSFKHFLSSTDLNWLKGMRSLKHLEMNRVDLSTVSADWIRIFDELPNLESFYAQACDIQKIDSNPLLANSSSLRILDLSYNNLPGASLLQWLSNLTALEFLDLSGSIQGKFFFTLTELPNLEELIMTHCHIDKNVSELFAGSWRKIRRVDLSVNGIYGELPNSLGNITSLEELVMEENNLTGYLSEKSLRNLKYVALSENHIKGIQVGNSTTLEHLDLSKNGVMFLQGEYLRNLINLKYLDLNANELISSIPKEMGLLTRLEYLRLSHNSIIGGIPPEIGNLSSLKIMSCSYNKIDGVIPKELGRMVSLNILDLMYNELTGGLPSTIGSMSSLFDLLLTENKLNGTLPSTIGQLSNLEALLLGDNYLHGPISEAHFQNMSKLKYLALDSNFFNFQLSQNWVPPFQLSILSLRSCYVGPAFPSWLRTQNNIGALDMSNTSIDDRIPPWFWNITKFCINLYLSDNKIRSHLPNPFPSYFPNATINLSNNLISGNIPSFSSSIQYLDLSDNLLEGSMPEDIFNVTVCVAVFVARRNKINGSIPSTFGGFQYIIDLSDNRLSGTIPFNLGQIRELEVLDLSGNQLSGKLQWPLVLLQNLKSLNLARNMIMGRLPFSLRNCSSIEILDIGENKFEGDIPRWIGTSFPALRVLRLRNNLFRGQIPSILSTLESLSVLDLAGNSLSGQIPKTLGGLRSMRQVNKTSTNTFSLVYYHERVFISMKGEMLEYSKTVLSLVSSIDFSFNNLSGPIPPELADLSGLLALNLSHNRLSGNIFNNIGHLNQLLSLDLSWNELSGEIPPSISNLTFLSKLNLSYNELSGRIPTGQQLQTLNDSSIYAGNSQLCGPVLSLKCPGDNPSNGQSINQISKEEDNSRIWIYVSIGTGFVSGFWVFYGVLIVKSSWRSAYFRLFDAMVVWLLVKLAAMKARIERKLQRD